MANAAPPVPATPEGRSHQWSAWLRSAAIVVLAAIGCAAFSAYIVVHWAEHQLLTTDDWVALVAPLPQQPAVTNALSTFVTDQVFDTAAVEQKVAAALPPQAAFLANPLTNQLHDATERVASRIITGDAFQAIWTAANRVAMNRVLTVARGQTPPAGSRIEERFTIDLSAVRDQLRVALGSTTGGVPALQATGAKALSLTADLRTHADRLHTYVQTVDFLEAVLPLGIVASLLLALALAHNRRRLVIVLASILLACMLLEIIGVRLLRGVVVGQVQQAYMPAVGYIYDVIVGGLRSSVFVAIACLTAVLMLGLLSGPYDWAIYLRAQIGLERLRQSTTFRWWREFRFWVYHYRYYIGIGIVAVVLIGLAVVVPVTPRSVVNALLLTAALSAATALLALPQTESA